MKIASFNINNINHRLTNLLDWLREAEPDIVCLQELKAANTEFPAEATRQAGYHAVYRGERSWNGVAILARWTPVVTRMDLPGDDGDRQCRHLEAAVNGVLVASIYAPDGNPQPGPKFDYKLSWLKRLDAHAAELFATGAPVVLAGDYNVVPTDVDIYPTKSWDDNATWFRMEISRDEVSGSRVAISALFNRARLPRQHHLGINSITNRNRLLTNGGRAATSVGRDLGTRGRRRRRKRRTSKLEEMCHEQEQYRPKDCIEAHAGRVKALAALLICSALASQISREAIPRVRRVGITVSPLDHAIGCSTTIRRG
jgi:exodeoxyribonuclease III